MPTYRGRQPVEVSSHPPPNTGLCPHRLLSTDVGTSPPVHVDVKVVSRVTRVLADQPSLVRLLDGHLHVASLVVELTTNVNVR